MKETKNDSRCVQIFEHSTVANVLFISPPAAQLEDGRSFDELHYPGAD